MRNLFAQFARAQRGVAAIEFALLMPLLVLMMLSSVELQRYLRIERQLSLAAENIANIVVQRQASDVTKPNFDFDAVYHLFPPGNEDPTNAWWNYIVHKITNVVFTPTVAGCTSNCTYKANAAWIWPSYDSGFSPGVMARSCGPLTAAASGASPTGKTIPAAMFGPGSVVIVDIGYRFKPLFGSNLVPPIDLFRQGYANARFASPYIQTPEGMTTRCAGY
jgi:Flp pilus assembly pilin Flp